MTLVPGGKVIVGGDAHNGSDGDFGVMRLTLAKGVTETTLSVKKKGDRVKASGRVTPNHAGSSAVVKLFKKKSGSFKLVDREEAKLSATSRYVARFERSNATRCRIDVRFPGDAHHKASA
jgi:hypothetical protein